MFTGKLPFPYNFTSTLNPEGRVFQLPGPQNFTLILNTNGRVFLPVHFTETLELYSNIKFRRAGIFTGKGELVFEPAPVAVPVFPGEVILVHVSRRQPQRVQGLLEDWVQHPEEGV